MKNNTPGILRPILNLNLSLDLHPFRKRRDAPHSRRFARQDGAPDLAKRLECDASRRFRTGLSSKKRAAASVVSGGAIAALLIVLTPPALAQVATSEPPKPAELGGMDIEQLMNIRVTTVARKEESVSETAAAVTVLTQEDIRRSGFTTIPEVLRLVPGLQVARLDAHDWAISSRGFNDLFANKLEVLVDGQSVYTPLFSGVFWEVQDNMLLEDIERIEVVRGPGASVWGANAVNGVINIITKKASDTQGGLLVGYGGTEERFIGGARYGGMLTTNLAYRAYLRYQDMDNGTFETGQTAYDSWQMIRGGFRADWTAPGDNLVTFKGEIYAGSEHQIFVVPVLSLTAPFSQTNRDRVDFSGGSMLGRWTHTFGESSSLQFQLYYDQSYRNALIFKEDRRNYDVDLQHRFGAGERNDIVWGAGYRASSDDLGQRTLSFNPSSRTLSVFSAFVQDEFAIVENRLSLMIGSKFEHNDFTGFEFQPTGRLLWRPGERQTFWGAVSRAVRTPSRAESDVRLNDQVLPPGVLAANLPAEIALVGDPNFHSETVLAYELGYRTELARRVFFDLSAFYNDYQDLRSLEPGQPFLETSPSPPHLVVPVRARNLWDGESFGAEASLTCRVTDWWRLRPAYSFLELLVWPQAGSGSRDTTVEASERASPRHQFFLVSSMDLLPNLQFDSNLRFVDVLPSLQTPSYWELDLRLAWQPCSNLELSVAGQNLVHAHHLEFNRSFVNEPRTEVDRGFYGKISWRF
jgi:iron complex outermembrane receptor protein